MKIGFVGTGKLGLPVSLMYATKGHELLCFDTNSNFYKENADPIDFLFDEERDPDNNGSLKEWLIGKELNLKFTDLKTVITNSDIVFVAVQTPHDIKYEGSTRLPDDRVDFDYTYLRNAMIDISNVCISPVPVVIISTVLPGTIRREIIPYLSDNIKLCYNPYFIAMGTVASDCLFPEFILLGTHDSWATETVMSFYKTICNCPVFSTSIENAEMIKVTYNTFITTKVVLANTIMDLCTRLPGTDCDEVIRGLSLGTRRIISPSYLKGGMGDGGGCHPRDNIALSWLTRNVGLHYDLYDSIMKIRESQCETIAKIIKSEYQRTNMNVYLLGKSFKPNTSITTGSSAVLLGEILKEYGIPFTFHDPHIEKTDILEQPSIFCVTCSHDKFLSYKLPDGSILIDPHRKYSNCISNGMYIPLGVNNS
jgi:UDPglucose 6-dehydrogenase